jgi:NADH dehydrogenase/NADH:ubiquinone oxidoreductase subunit G
MTGNQDMVTLNVDGRQIEAAEGAVLLEVCLENDIFVPNLCFLKGMDRAPASCRMCFVAVEGRPEPVPSCSTPVSAGMVVHTDTPAVRRLQRAGLKLLLSVHDIDCKNCPANKRCELQRLARFLKAGLNAKPLETRLKTVAVDDSHPYLIHYPNRCVLCGRCITVCAGKGHHAALTFAKRGLETVVSAYGQHAEGLSCPTCAACADICPVGALVLKETPTGAETG